MRVAQEELDAYRQGVESGAMKNATPNVVRHLLDEIALLQKELERVSKLWGQLHTACSELVSLVETVGDMEDEGGAPFWEPELANAMRWLHYYPECMAEAEKEE